MKPFLIAEISSNHNGDLNRAKDMISLAAELDLMQSSSNFSRSMSCFHQKLPKVSLEIGKMELPIDFRGS